MRPFVIWRVNPAEGRSLDLLWPFAKVMHESDGDFWWYAAPVYWEGGTPRGP